MTKQEMERMLAQVDEQHLADLPAHDRPARRPLLRRILPVAAALLLAVPAVWMGVRLAERITPQSEVAVEDGQACYAGVTARMTDEDIAGCFSDSIMMKSPDGAITVDDLPTGTIDLVGHPFHITAAWKEQRTRNVSIVRLTADDADLTLTLEAAVDLDILMPQTDPVYPMGYSAAFWGHTSEDGRTACDLLACGTRYHLEGAVDQRTAMEMVYTLAGQRRDPRAIWQGETDNITGRGLVAPEDVPASVMAGIVPEGGGFGGLVAACPHLVCAMGETIISYEAEFRSLDQTEFIKARFAQYGAGYSGLPDLSQDSLRSASGEIGDCRDYQYFWNIDGIWGVCVSGTCREEDMALFAAELERLHDAAASLDSLTDDDIAALFNGNAGTIDFALDLLGGERVLGGTPLEVGGMTFQTDAVYLDADGVPKNAALHTADGRAQLTMLTGVDWTDRLPDPVSPLGIPCGLHATYFDDGQSECYLHVDDVQYVLMTSEMTRREVLALIVAIARHPADVASLYAPLDLTEEELDACFPRKKAAIDFAPDFDGGTHLTMVDMDVWIGERHFWLTDVYEAADGTPRNARLGYNESGQTATLWIFDGVDWTDTLGGPTSTPLGDDLGLYGSYREDGCSESYLHVADSQYLLNTEGMDKREVVPLLSDIIALRPTALTLAQRNTMQMPAPSRSLTLAEADWLAPCEGWVPQKERLGGLTADRCLLTEEPWTLEVAWTANDGRSLTAYYTLATDSRAPLGEPAPALDGAWSDKTVTQSPYATASANGLTTHYAVHASAGRCQVWVTADCLPEDFTAFVECMSGSAYADANDVPRETHFATFEEAEAAAPFCRGFVPHDETVGNATLSLISVGQTAAAPDGETYPTLTVTYMGRDETALVVSFTEMPLDLLADDPASVLDRETLVGGLRPQNRRFYDAGEFRIMVGAGDVPQRDLDAYSEALYQHLYSEQ